MNLTNNNDTICALATGGGMSAIALIRLSGTDSIKIANKIFNVNLSSIEGIKYGNMIMQSHDIIHIKPNFNMDLGMFQSFQSIFTFISSISILLLTLNQN